MYHLMDDAVANPGPLFTRGAIDEGIVRAELHCAHPCREDTVQVLIITGERCAVLPWIEVLLHPKARQRDTAFNPMDEDVGVAEAVGVKQLKAVMFATDDIAAS